MIVTNSYDNHIFVIYTTFTFKTADVRANNVKHLSYMAETLLRLVKSPEFRGNMHFSNNCSRCTMHSNKVLKSLQFQNSFDENLFTLPR